MPSVTCPKCHTKLNLSKLVEGAKITCPSCGAKFPLSAKKAGRTIHAADPIEDEEMEDDVASFLGDDPMVWVKMGVFMLLLLMPMFLVLIWSLARRPSFMSGSSLISNRMIMPLDAERDKTAEATTSRQGLPKIIVKAQHEDSKWQEVNFPMPIDRKHDPRLGVWKFGDQTTGEYEMMSLEQPKDGDAPPRQYVDAYFSGYRPSMGFSAARITLWIVQSNEDGVPVRLSRQLVAPVWTVPLNADGTASVGKPNGIFHGVMVIPKEMTDKLPVTPGNMFRDEYETVTYVEPIGESIGNMHALMPTKNIKKNTRADGIVVTVEFDNYTGRTLRNPLIAIDVYDQNDFFLGTFSGSGPFEIPAGQPWKVMVEIPYPDGFKPADPAEATHKFKIKARGMAQG